MGFEPRQPTSHLEGVNDFVDRMKNTLEEAKSALTKAKDDMAMYYNRRRTPAPDYKPGEKVYLDASDIKTTRPSQKLAHRYLGPFVVERKIGPSAYRLRLPTSLSRLHPVFNVVKLLSAPPDPIPGRRSRPPPPPVLVQGEEHYEVEGIIDSRMFRQKLQFLVKWKGYGYEENSWVNETEVNAAELVQEFYDAHPGAPRRIRATDFQKTRFRSHADLSANWRAPLARRDAAP
jgi:hypothetical protein